MLDFMWFMNMKAKNVSHTKTSMIMMDKPVFFFFLFFNLNVFRENWITEMSLSPLNSSISAQNLL